MREIKYRQKLKPEYCNNTEPFHYWGFIDDCFHSPCNPNSAINYEDSEQYTEIERDGREVYEGDVYYVAGTGNCVVGIDPYLGVIFTDSEGEESSWIDEIAENNIGDYLGNIHENPELMEQ